MVRFYHFYDNKIDFAALPYLLILKEKGKQSKDQSKIRNDEFSNLSLHFDEKYVALWNMPCSAIGKRAGRNVVLMKVL
jgi:hypothetical protein